MSIKGLALSLFLTTLFCGFTNNSLNYLKAQKVSVSDTLLSNKAKKQYLELKGVVKQTKTNPKGNEEVLDSARIQVYEIDGKNKKAVFAFYTNGKGKCDFKLPLDKSYVLEIVKEGYVSKYIEINTKVPEKEKSAFIFPFSVDIFEKVDGLDVTILQRPIAKVSYSFTYDQFNYDYTYTERVNGELKKMYADYYYLQTVEVDNDSTGTSTKKFKSKSK